MKHVRVIGAAVVLATVTAGPAVADSRAASIGNFWFQDDATGDRSKIVVRIGDQIVFTVREGIYPPHTVDVDELNIHSPGLLLGESYTTPPIRKAGNFKLYCRPHETRGHFTRLVVQQVAAQTPAPTAAPAPAQPTRAPQAAASPAPGASATPPGPTSSPAESLLPVGVSKADDGVAAQGERTDPESLNNLLERGPNTAPWTRSLWWLLIAAVPIVAAAAYALRAEVTRPAPATSTAASPTDRPRSTKRSPRSSAPKASGSGRTSRGRRR